MRRGYLIIIVLVLSSLACVLINLVKLVPTAEPTSLPASTPLPVITRTPGPTSEEPTKTPYPTSALDAQLSNEINQIQTQVIEERGLQPNSPCAGGIAFS